MNSSPPTMAEIARPASPMHLENHASNPQAKLEIQRGSTVDSTPQDEEPKASLPMKPRKKSAKSQNARAGSAGPPVQADVNGEPAYPLHRVQKIVKMNDQAQISREAVFVMALAAEHITRRLTRAGCDVAKNAHRVDLSLTDVATAVQASTSLSFLAEVIPQTIPLSTARSRRLTKDITPFPPDMTQAMISRLQDQLRHSARPITAYTTTPVNKPSSAGGVGIPIATIVPSPGSVPVPVRNYSPREAAAVAKSKAGQSGSNGRSFAANAAGMPVGPLGPMMPLPPGFDYRALAGMPPPPPGMTYHHIDPESYRNGIRWAPVQAQQQPGVSDAQGQGPEGMLPLPTGMWTDASGQLIMPAAAAAPNSQMYAAIPPTQQPTSSNSRSARRAPRQRKQNDTSSGQSQQAQSQPSPSPSPASGPTPTTSVPTTTTTASPSQQTSGSAPGSPFHPGQLQGRTIYSAGTGGAFAPDSPPAKTNGMSKKKRASTKGRGSTARKALERDEEEEDGDSMDLNP